MKDFIRCIYMVVGSERYGLRPLPLFGAAWEFCWRLGPNMWPATPSSMGNQFSFWSCSTFGRGSSLGRRFEGGVAIMDVSFGNGYGGKAWFSCHINGTSRQ